MQTEQTKMPASVVRRLPKYLTHTQRLRRESVAWVSSMELAEALGLTSSTVRQDLSHIDFCGVSKRGYSTAGLATSLAEALGADREVCVVVVGAGNLGRALVLHDEFARQGFKVCGVFDADSDVVGEKVGRLLVQGMDRLPETVCGKDVDVGIIAVPAKAAQEVADHLILSGVRGILNMTAAHVVAPDKVAVVDARIVASLQELSYAIKTQGART
jgi:redox-sensing transcriptional repressor